MPTGAHQPEITGHGPLGSHEGASSRPQSIGTDEHTATGRAPVLESRDNSVGLLLHAHELLTVLRGDAAAVRLLVQCTVEVGAVHSQAHHSVGERDIVRNIS